jgi:phospholipid/cholesterol/gamma-HCH transport system substrate-binding protein
MSTYSRGYDLARVGALGVVAIVAFIGLFMYVTNRGLALTRTDVFVRLPVATGLRKGDPVLFRGVLVGEVKRLVFMEAGDVLVQARITEEVPLTTHARAELVPVDLFGRQSVVLLEGQHGKGRLLATDDTIPGQQPASMSAKITDLGVRAERMLSDSMVTLMHETLAGSAAATRQMERLGRSMEQLVGAQQASVTTLTREAAVIAHNLAVVTAPAELEATRGHLMSASARFDTLTVTLASLLGGIERGQGNAGLLLGDDALYVRTTSLLASVEDLIRDMKANPRKYINLEIF